MSKEEREGVRKRGREKEEMEGGSKEGTEVGREEEEGRKDRKEVS